MAKNVFFRVPRPCERAEAATKTSWESRDTYIYADMARIFNGKHHRLYRYVDLHCYCAADDDAVVSSSAFLL